MVRGFNPRPREGGDIVRVIRQGEHYRFNPRPREGGDKTAPKRNNN